MNNSLVNELEKWKTEANSPFNDGWTKKHYQDKIERIKEWLDEHDTTSENGGV
tara:strand:+ start:436 stop:594 length:159 start_codon:yes stop_codon:yes gene_type:complete